MAIPKFEDFLYPFLSQLKDQDVTKKDMKKALIAHFHLTEDDCQQRTKSGTTNQLDDRIGWSLQWLRRALFVEIPQKGTYHITQRGLDYLATHTDLRQTDLLEYPEYAAYAKKTVGSVNDKIKTDLLANHGETPTEQLELAFTKINDDLAEDILQKTLAMSSDFFERLVVDLLLRMGYGDPTDNSAMVTQRSHDNGIDGVIPQDKLGFDKIYIQAKRYQPENTIGKPAIQAFSGALDEQKATKGVFITTGTFSKEARNFVEKSSKKIVLIDGQQLSRYMIEYNVGVSCKKVYEVKKMDTDYFEE